MGDEDVELRSEVAESCPWAGSCVNSEGQCQGCNKSPWYDTDGGRCVCGPGQADWIHQGQCQPCMVEDGDVELQAQAEVVDSCPYVSRCMNSQGACAACNKSPWYDSDHKCVCGPSASDWITSSGECTPCMDEDVDLRSEVTESCPWAGSCMNSEGQCQGCNKSPWYDTDGGRCVCGPGQADWIQQGQCQPCMVEEASSVNMMV